MLFFFFFLIRGYHLKYWITSFVVIPRLSLLKYKMNNWALAPISYLEGTQVFLLKVNQDTGQLYRKLRK